METAKGKNNFKDLDEVDIQILKHLQQNAKFDIKQLPDVLNMTKTPVYKRIIALEEAGFITRYVALLDRKLVGLPLMVFCAVSLSVQNAEYIAEFNKQVKDIEEIIECYLIGGVSDFIFKGDCKRPEKWE
ncbi:MAG: AsnC family transcriptional regulator [Mucilaginibacter sp.]|nr:AsnC family transcriptional regulator [Mucilaginibacter sp.]